MYQTFFFFFGFELAPDFLDFEELDLAAFLGFFASEEPLLFTATFLTVGRVHNGILFRGLLPLFLRLGISSASFSVDSESSVGVK